jgi:hypothetical protein
MDVERLEWPCQMQTAQLFDGHVGTISAIGPRFNDFAGMTQLRTDNASLILFRQRIA